MFFALLISKKSISTYQNTWRGGRVVECGALEMRFGATQRGFESPPLRSIEYRFVFLPEFGR